MVISSPTGAAGAAVVDTFVNLLVQLYATSSTQEEAEDIQDQIEVS